LEFSLNKEIKLLRVSWFFSFIILTAGILFGIFSTDKQSIYQNDTELCGIYCKMAMDYGNLLNQYAFDKYYFQKSFGSFLIHFFFKIFDIKLTPQSVNYALECLSYFSLILSLVMCNLISSKLRMSARKYWLFFFLLFISQLLTKLVPYAQETPDALSFFLGMWVLFSIIMNSFVSIIFIFIISFGVQPQLTIVLIPLLLFWGVTSNKGGCHFKKNYKFSGQLTFNSKFIYLFIFFFYLIVFTLSGFFFPMIVTPYMGTNNMILNLLPLSIFLESAFLTLALVKINFVRLVCDLLDFLRTNTFILRIIAILIALVIKTIIVAKFANGPILSPSSTFLGSLWLFYTFHYQAVEQPLKSVISHIIFFGPAAFLIYYTWNKVEKSCNELRWGPGVLMMLSLILALSVDAESRHFFAFMPLLVFLAVYTLDKIGFFTWSGLVLGSILFSRFWGSYSLATPEDDHLLFTWGPWWTVNLYIKASVIILVLIILIYSFLLVDDKLHKSYID
jgi:hypothetical protein